jgi:hypothetical protein
MKGGSIYQNFYVGNRNTNHCETISLIKAYHEIQIYKSCLNHCHFVRVPEHYEMLYPEIPAIIRDSNYPGNSHQMLHHRIVKVLTAVINYMHSDRGAFLHVFPFFGVLRILR